MGRLKEAIHTLWGQPNKGIAGEPDPEDLTVDNAYKTRWIWYHTFMALELSLIHI